ncbi:ABC transporter permease [bacterium D16-51]|nr:ABC transporter permease [bacterium D16-59]RKI59223.1 ABC transporter permease [bacterium D16-51]
MEYFTLWRAGTRRHKGSLAGVFLLMLFINLALGTVLTLWNNSGSYIRSEMRRAGFGDLTAWVHDVPEQVRLADEIAGLDEVERVDSQRVIYADYTIKEQESDSQGQLIHLAAEEDRYRFFLDDLSGYQEKKPEIAPGEIYVSPSMVSMFGLQIGDEINFAVARSGGNFSFQVKGFYEDPFMGSSMIGMKGFLVCEADWKEIQRMIQERGKNALAREGAMLHIFSDDRESVSDLNRMMNENTALSQYTEFIHSEDAIAGFMLILQNAFSGLLIAFVFVLLFVAMVALGHSLSSGIEADTVNMGILKTVGFTTGKLRQIQLMQYLTAIVSGMLAGFVLSVPVSRIASEKMITTTGIHVPAGLPFEWILLSDLAVLLLLILFIFMKTERIRHITPMMAIRRDGQVQLPFPGKKVLCGIKKNALYFRLARRQLATAKRLYISTCVVAVLLVFFVSLVGRMDSWLGRDGKGMMDAFNPADHDIGVQVFGELTAGEAEELVSSYTGITDSYLLAMPNVSVNGTSYTANVISEPKRFHMMQGKTCQSEDEIVVTEFVAKDMDVKVGDRLMVQGDKGREEYTVSGIYQCANDMGANIGMSREGYLKIGQDNPHLWCYHYFLADNSVKEEITETLETAYGGDVHVHENSWPGLYGIISAMQVLVVFMYGMVFVFTLIVTVMTGSKILAAETKDLGIYKAIGFTSTKLRFTFAMRFCLTAVAGSVIGIFLAAVCTDSLVSAVMKLAGISNFASHPGLGEMLFPAGVVILLFMGFSYLTAGRIKRVAVTVLMGE